MRTFVQVLELEGLLKNSKVSPDESCLAAHERCSDCESGVYWIETDSMASPQEVRCRQLYQQTHSKTKSLR